MNLADLVEGASSDFDVGLLTLNVSIPQAYVPGQSRGYVDSSHWNEGVTAAYTNYQANFSTIPTPDIAATTITSACAAASTSAHGGSATSRR
ncbi:papC N-terminal domain protein [Burkholderia cepacia]|nr:papC N-terminal domain protein [Burkholderia cepacia]